MGPHRSSTLTTKLFATHLSMRLARFPIKTTFGEAQFRRAHAPRVPVFDAMAETSDSGVRELKLEVRELQHARRSCTPGVPIAGSQLEVPISRSFRWFANKFLQGFAPAVEDQNLSALRQRPRVRHAKGNRHLARHPARLALILDHHSRVPARH